MHVKNLNAVELDRALALTNKRYDDNLEFNYVRCNGHSVDFTLRVKDSHGKGARIGFYSHRHLINACWHAHGHLFENILKIQPRAIIQTMMSTIYKDEYDNIVGNWQDKNIGSIVSPLMYSEACEC